MPQRLCPWWAGYFLASPIRRWFEDPGAILGARIRGGMTVLEPGPGMGFFTLELARRVGPTGRVVAVDIQPKMLAGLERRARRAGVADRVSTRLARPDSLGIEDLRGQVDFVLAYAVVHEMSDAGSFFLQAAEALKPGGTMLLAEPRGHVKEPDFEAELAAAARAGLEVAEQPPIGRKHSALLRRRGSTEPRPPS